MTAAAAAGAAEGAAGAAAAAGAPASPVSLEAKLDLTDAFNRLGESWYDVFSGTSQISMPAYGCVYPAAFTEAEIDEISQYTRPEDHHLRWQMAMDTIWPGDEGRYNLRVDWEGRSYESSGGYGYLFIEALNPWVDWFETGYGWKLYIEASTQEANFYNGIASIIVDFHVKETDGGDDIVRDTHRKFRCYADGRREPQF